MTKDNFSGQSLETKTRRVVAKMFWSCYTKRATSLKSRIILTNVWGFLLETSDNIIILYQNIVIDLFTLKPFFFFWLRMKIREGFSFWWRPFLSHMCGIKNDDNYKYFMAHEHSIWNCKATLLGTFKFILSFVNYNPECCW